MNFFNRLKIKPLQLTLDISGECNAKCPFCLRQSGESVPEGFMKKEVFYEAVEQAKKIKSIKTISLSAYGEALLHPDFDEFVDYLSELKYKILVITNMSLANKHYSSLLKTDYLMMSIEGYDRETYEKYRRGLDFAQVEHNIIQFDKMVRELRAEKEHTPSRMINCLITKKTEADKFNRQWKPYTDLITTNLMVRPISWDNTKGLFFKANHEFKGEIIEKDEGEKRLICTEPFRTIVMHPNGRLALCCNDANCSLDFGDYKNIKKAFFDNKNLNKIRKELLENTCSVCKNCTTNIIIKKEQ
ncbi:radical SAM protein [bacterium]|nr:radical SAM protein [bacterium]